MHSKENGEAVKLKRLSGKLLLNGGDSNKDTSIQRFTAPEQDMDDVNVIVNP